MAPELEHGDGAIGPPADPGDGDRRPERDWYLILFGLSCIAAGALIVAHVAAHLLNHLEERPKP